MTHEEAGQLLADIQAIYSQWQPESREIELRISKATYYDKDVADEALKRFLNTKEGSYNRPKFYHLFKICDQIRMERQPKKNSRDNRPATLFTIKCVSGYKQGQVTRFAITKRRLIPDFELVRQAADKQVERLKRLYHDCDFETHFLSQEEPEPVTRKITDEEKLGVETDILDGEDCAAKRFVQEMRDKGISAMVGGSVKDIKGKYEKDYDNELTA